MNFLLMSTTIEPGLRMSLEGKVALVTGACRGIGRAIAEHLAHAGAHVVINYRSAGDEARGLRDRLAALGKSATELQTDVTNPDQVQQAVSEVVNVHDHLDILVNNVGEFSLSSVAGTSLQRWHHVLDSNLNSTFYMIRSALPVMREQMYGRIINIGLAPVHLVRGAPNLSAYTIAKTGVVTLTRSLAVEEAPYGVTVNCVSPGLIDNGFLPPEQREWMSKRVPMRRLGSVDDVANAVSFLVSPEASYISGANLTVSGAWEWEDRATTHDGDVEELFRDEAADA